MVPKPLKAVIELPNISTESHMRNALFAVFATLKYKIVKSDFWIKKVQKLHEDNWMSAQILKLYILTKEITWNFVTVFFTFKIFSQILFFTAF